MAAGISVAQVPATTNRVIKNNWNILDSLFDEIDDPTVPLIISGHTQKMGLNLVKSSYLQIGGPLKNVDN